MYLEEKIDALLSKQNQLLEMVELFLPNLETEKGVIHFLEITKNTFNTYLSDNVFQENVHYQFINNKRVFIANAIIKLKKIGIKGKRKGIQKNNKYELDKLDFLNNKLGIMPCAGIPSNMKDVS